MSFAEETLACIRSPVAFELERPSDSGFLDFSLANMLDSLSGNGGISSKTVAWDEDK